MPSRDEHRSRPDREEKVPQTKPIPGGDPEFKQWVEKRPKPDPNDPEKGNRPPPDPRNDQIEPNEPGTTEPEEI